jgi:hypothetical protein
MSTLASAAESLRIGSDSDLTYWNDSGAITRVLIEPAFSRRNLVISLEVHHVHSDA